MPSGDRGASVNRTAPRKAKRVAKPVDLSGVKGSGKAQTGVRSAPVVKAAAVRSVSRMKGSGAAGFAVKQDSRPVKKQSVVCKSLGVAIEPTRFACDRQKDMVRRVVRVREAGAE